MCGYVRVLRMQHTRGRTCWAVERDDWVLDVCAGLLRCGLHPAVCGGIVWGRGMQQRGTVHVLCGRSERVLGRSDVFCVCWASDVGIQVYAMRRQLVRAVV
eukprot:PhF_6_TR38612/c2_g1_i1/m.57498